MFPIPTHGDAPPAATQSGAFFRAGLAPVLALAICAQFAAPAQDYVSHHVSPLAMPAPQVDAKVDPMLLADAEQLAGNGFIRELDRVRQSMRVVIELNRQESDVDFESARSGDALAEVQFYTIQRQGLFLQQLEAKLTPRELAGFNLLFPIDLQYMVAAEIADLATLRAVAALVDVKYVWKDSLNELFDVEGRTLTGSAVAAANGATGAGVGVAVIDTNFDLLHPELGGSTNLPNSAVKGGYNFSTPGASIHSRVFGDCYHGTGTASIVRRYAPGCDLYALVVFPNSYDSVIANAINWCVANKNGANGGAPIRALNMSLGGGRYTTPQNAGTLHTACGNARANGILCIAAAGNNGWTDSLALPAASTNCISVGSTWDANNAPYSPFWPAYCSDSVRVIDERACYSNTAPFLSVYCPSEQVICAMCGGGTFALGGTSSAAPAAAGLTAQLLQFRPHLRGNLDGVVNLFRASGAVVAGDNTKRRVNLTGALQQSATTTHTLWATSVPETSSPANIIPWTDESHAAGAETCNDCNTSNCQYSTNSTNGNTTPLRAVDFQAFSLPVGQRITNVRVEVAARYNTNTSANVGFRAFAPSFALNSNWRNSTSFSSGTACAPRLGTAGDITGLSANWTAAMVNDLQFEVRRQANLSSNTLRIVSMRLVVTTSY
jgi:hypothetical protein